MIRLYTIITTIITITTTTIIITTTITTILILPICQNQEYSYQQFFAENEDRDVIADHLMKG